MTAEATASAEYEKDYAKRRAAARAKNQRKKRRILTPAEKQQKARELEGLLKQTAAFSDIITGKTRALGRMGTTMDGTTLGEHNLELAQQPKCMVGGTMRDYQLEGLTWMREIAIQGLSGILADEMGLGMKTHYLSLSFYSFLIFLSSHEMYYLARRRPANHLHYRQDGANYLSCCLPQRA